MQAFAQTDAAQALGSEYVRLAELALARHAARTKALPKRPAPAFLRAALGSVRELGHLSQYVPRLLTTAQELLARLAAAAREAEERCFAAGGNSAPYINFLIACETWRIRLLSAAAQLRAKEREIAPAPTAAPAPKLPALPRRYVPADQGGRHKERPG